MINEKEWIRREQALHDGLMSEWYDYKEENPNGTIEEFMSPYIDKNADEADLELIDLLERSFFDACSDHTGEPLVWEDYCLDLMGFNLDE